ncbi:MAG TPA: hypothetical protein VN841_05875 [Bryobacteraceae bacterium]|nr:hypothetical protein [Bryobacteraceae bacterium]
MNQDFYAGALRRIRWLAVAVGLGGTIAVLVAQGVRPASGFLAGAALSLLNFQGLASMANALGGTGSPRVFAAMLIALRYLLIGAAIYAIVKLLGFTPVAVLWGLLAAFGAVVLEILCELIFHGQEAHRR